MPCTVNVAKISTNGNNNALNESSKHLLNENNNNIIVDDEETKTIQKLENSLSDLREALNLFVCNKYSEAFEFCQQKMKQNPDLKMPYLHVSAILKFVHGLLTLEQKQLQNSLDLLKKDSDSCASMRKKVSFTESLTSFFWKRNYEDYSDAEVNATICHAEAQIMQGLLTFFNDQSILGMIKGAMKVMNAQRTYGLCTEIVKHKKNFKSELLRQELECGSLIGSGTMNLVLSHLPNKIIKLLSLAGFSGSYQAGIAQMQQAIESTDSLRKDIATIIIIAYNLYMEHVLGTGEGNLSWAQSLTQSVIKRYPQSAFFKFFEGRLSVLYGEPLKSRTIFNECLSLQAEWKPLHHICYWDILWSFALQKDWLNAAKYAKLLKDECQWSPATNTYQYAVFLYHYAIESNNKKILQEVDECMKSVPKLKIRWAGKCIPQEKFVCTHASRFSAGDRFPLPAYELFYIWNIFFNTCGKPELVGPIHKDISEALETIEKDGDIVNWNHYCVLLLLNGVCLKYSNRYDEALKCFTIINENEKKLSQDYSYVAPHACLEQGLTLWKAGLLDDAKLMIEKARENYSDYLIEAMVQLRSHNALKRIDNPITPLPTSLSTKDEKDADDDKNTQMTSL